MSVHVFPGKQGCQVNWGELRVKKELSAAELDYLGSLIPTTVDARARNGSVTLTGTADRQYRRDEAEFLTVSVPGCPQSRTNIRLTSTQNARDVKKDISDAFLRNAKLDADRLFIDTTSYRRVTLAGTVSSWTEHDEAEDVAWSAPGVTEVDDQIQVAY